MVVEFNTGGANFIPLRQGPARRSDAASVGESGGNEDVSFETQQLAQSLPKPPADVRPEKLARAAALAADPNYPSDAQLAKLADLLAKHL